MYIHRNYVLKMRIINEKRILAGFLPSFIEHFSSEREYYKKYPERKEMELWEEL